MGRTKATQLHVTSAVPGMTPSPSFALFGPWPHTRPWGARPDPGAASGAGFAPRLRCEQRAEGAVRGVHRGAAARCGGGVEENLMGLRSKWP